MIVSVTQQFRVLVSKSQVLPYINQRRNKYEQGIAAMGEVPFSHLKLKRSASVDSIQTGLNNIIARMQFSQLLQQELNDIEDDCIDGGNNKKDSSISDFDADSNLRRKTASVNKSERNCIVNGDRRRKNERISSEEFKMQNMINIYEQDPEMHLNEKDSRKISPRRCSSYYDEYSKREGDRQKAREMAANLVRAQKVKKEFSDGMKSSYNFSPTKKSGKILNRRNSNSAISPSKILLPVASTTSIPDTSAPKIRLHTTATSYPMPPQGISPTRSPRHRVLQEKGIS